jgi:hypothetical protein
LNRHPQGRSKGRRGARRRGALAALAAGVAALALSVAPAIAAAAEAPTVLATGDATAVTYTTAGASGVAERAADPGPESDASCKFEYVSDAQFRGTGFKDAAKAPCDTDPLTVPGPNPVGTELTGLKPGTEYHLRLTASNSAGSSSLEAANTFTTTAVTPPAVTLDAPTAVTATSAHFSGTVNPEAGAGPAELYEAQWRFRCVPECLGPGGEELSGDPIPPGNAPVAVFADAVLEPNTLYRVSLIATNAGGSASAGPLSFTTPQLAPLARTLSAGAGVTTAQLGAKLNPRNAPLTYQFQWGTTLAYGNLAPAAPASLPFADNSFHVVAEPLGGLSPQSTYHYRVVATNTETGTEAFGADRTFTTLAVPTPPPPCPNAASQVNASAGLPDCRAYELTTPGLKGSAPGEGWPQLTVEGILADGSALAFQSDGTPENAEGAAAATATLVARRGPGGWATKSLSPPAPLTSANDFGDARSTVGLSADLTQSVVWSNQPLAGSSSPAGTNLYLRRADGSFLALTKAGAPAYAPGGELLGASEDFKRLFIVSTVKQLAEDPVAGGNAYEWAAGNLKLVAVLPGGALAPEGGSLPQGALPAVSEDGSEVLFKAKGLKGLYLRTNATDTVEVSASQRTVNPDPNPPADAIAAGMSADGSKVLFTSASELTNDSYTGRSGGIANDKGADLYSYDTKTKVLTDLTVGTNPADALTGAGVEAVLGASADASYVYFTARGNLAEGAASGERNLYVAHNGTVEFVGSDPSTAPGQFYVTPSGLYAAFTSTAPQTGYDNAGFAQAYEYTYGAGVACGSCRPSGEVPASGASLAGRSLSGDGTRLFFQSADAILAGAQSGQANVFEYAGSEVHLLSPGEGSPALLLGASASGDDVFIASFEDLAPQGQGEVFAIYDARAGASVPQPGGTAGCQGETCRAGVLASPEAEGPGSAGFEAPGRIGLTAPKALVGKKAQLRAIVPGAGEISLTGRGTVPLTRRVAKAGPVALVLALKPGAERKRQKFGSYKTEIEISFKSPAGVSRANATVTFEATAKKKGAAK